MPTIKLTRTSVDRLKYEGKQECYFDPSLPGFGVRVNAKSKAYFVQTRVAGKEIKEQIGKVSIVEFDDARSRAKKILDDAAQGIIPESKRETVSEPCGEVHPGITLQEIFVKYQEMRKLKPSTLAEYTLILRTHLSDWQDRPIRAITGAMVLERHATIGKASPARADGVMRVLRALCTYTIDMYDDAVLLNNPCRKLTAMRAWNRVGRKTTFIPAQRLGGWLSAVLAIDSQVARDCILLLLFTGARRNEICSLQWKDVDLEEGTAHFRDTKAGELLVPLCEYALGILQQRKEVSGESPYVFPGNREGQHYKDPHEYMKIVEIKTGIKVIPHDLRRGFLSYCNDLKIPVFTQKRLVGHALPKDVTEGYIQFTMRGLREEVERVASYILSNAGITPS